MQYRFCFLASFALALIGESPAAAEVLVGLKQGDTVPKCVEPDPAVGHRYKAGCKESYLVRSGATYSTSYNQLGLRDKDYPANPPKGWKRILFIGGKRIAAPGLEEAFSPPRLLEKKLRENGIPKVEVINAGVENYFLLHQTTKIKEWLDAYHPTHVLLNLDIGTEVGTAQLFLPYAENGEDGLPAAIRFKVLRWMRPFAWIFGGNPDDFQSMRRTYTWQSGLFYLYRGYRCGLFMRSRGGQVNCLAAPAVSMLEKLKKLVESRGATLYVVMNSGEFRARLAIGPMFEEDVLRRVDMMAPSSRVLNASYVAGVLRKYRVPLILMTEIVPPEDRMPGDFHFNKNGSANFSKNLAIRLMPFLAD